jgi:hypothetical protein
MDNACASFPSDDGEEFINTVMKVWRKQWEIAFTRIRARGKNDGCHVEE